MNKFILAFILLFLIVVVLTPQFSYAEGGLVPCDGPNCTLCSFFEMLANIYDFIVKNIATPLAILALTIGGILILISAGNPNLLSLGKGILYSAIIGLVLVWGSFLIINFTLHAIGYNNADSWSSLNLNCN